VKLQTNTNPWLQSEINAENDGVVEPPVTSSSTRVTCKQDRGRGRNKEMEAGLNEDTERHEKKRLTMYRALLRRKKKD